MTTLDRPGFRILTSDLRNYLSLDGSGKLRLGTTYDYLINAKAALAREAALAEIEAGNGTPDEKNAARETVNTPDALAAYNFISDAANAPLAVEMYPCGAYVDLQIENHVVPVSGIVGGEFEMINSVGTLIDSTGTWSSDTAEFTEFMEAVDKATAERGSNGGLSTATKDLVVQRAGSVPFPCFTIQTIAGTTPTQFRLVMDGKKLIRKDCASVAWVPASDENVTGDKWIVQEGMGIETLTNDATQLASLRANLDLPCPDTCKSGFSFAANTCIPDAPPDQEQSQQEGENSSSEPAPTVSTETSSNTDYQTIGVVLFALVAVGGLGVMFMNRQKQQPQRVLVRRAS